MLLLKVLLLKVPRFSRVTGKGGKGRRYGKTVECSSAPEVRNSTENGTPPQHYYGVLHELNFGNPDSGQLQLHRCLL